MTPGDTVICLDDSPCKCGCGEPAPVCKGVIYVVERVLSHPSRPEPLLVLVGVRCASLRHGWVAPSSTRFKRLEEMKAMLAKINNHEPVNGQRP